MSNVYISQNRQQILASSWEKKRRAGEVKRWWSKTAKQSFYTLPALLGGQRCWLTANSDDQQLPARPHGGQDAAQLNNLNDTAVKNPFIGHLLPTLPTHQL
ncbi:hypothetical protein COT66_01775 [Candidatus Shapirobacteria bacterium CG09_land_8_20_14_0_10_49_15]|uniref:Uncharacterized protein n=1 Tax=Candidatus Shapirobacteria bacterium CG09_land_8_20_14_0_10_49_15 TaxID=1974482 RepID=A0A2M6XAY3_9BACT|nr:MAG: hypothetical protein COT66_01775 [Candidatus Shapirobacteria bacterium CG09_land_8_20_14_0_10_49_15]